LLNRQTGIYGGVFLRVYKSKEELKAEINKTFEKYISEFDSIPEALKDKRVDEVDRTPAENLAYQVGWTTLVLKWEEDERKGLQVKTPSDEFKWNQLGELYQWFTDTYAHLSLQELKAELNENVKSICAMIDSLSADELFKPHMRKWADDATKAAVWEVYRFIHVNTVAPFGTFRTKIRKWKKPLARGGGGLSFSPPPALLFQRSKFYLCVGSFTAPREWLIPPSTNINVYAAAEQLTFQMI